MKKLLLALCLVAATGMYGQRVQGTIKAGGEGNQVILAIRPTQAFVAQMTNLALSIQIPTSVGVRPTVTMTNLQPALFSTWTQQDEPDQGDGFYTWSFNCVVPGGSNTPATNWSTAEMDVLRIAFSQGTGSSQVRMCHYLDGGATGFSIFYVETNLAAVNGGVLSDWGNLFYGPGASNGAPAPGNIGVPNANYSFVPIGGVILPVQFASFNAACNDKGALLTWTTSAEYNSDKFEIQRSADGGASWTTIDNVKAAGTSNMTRNYQYIDLQGGTAFYRIREVDFDGNFVYTAIKSTNCKVGAFEVSLFPIPAKDRITVLIKSDIAAKTDLRIFDMTGKVVQVVNTQINKGNNNIVLDLSALPSGQYMLKSNEAGLSFDKKFTINR